MSLSVEKLPTLLALDPRIDNSQSRNRYIIQKGAKNVTQKIITTQSISDTSISWSAPPPNTFLYVDRTIYYRVSVEFTFTKDPTNGQLCFGAGDGGNALLNPAAIGTILAPRAYPLAQVITTQQLSINNCNFTNIPRDYMETLLRINTDTDDQIYCNSVTPTFPDQSQNYEDAFASNRNPLQNYYTSVHNANNGRGGYSGIRITENTTSQGKLILTVFEPLFISPLAWGASNNLGLSQVKTFDVTISLGDLTRMLSYNARNASSQTFTSVVGVVQPQPALLFTYLSPGINEVPSETLVYPYSDIQRYPQSIGALGLYNPVTDTSPGAGTFASNNITLSVYPQRWVIFARRRNFDDTIYTTNSYARINSISFNISNKAGLLSQASPIQLYEMSRRSGLKMSFDEWYKYQGSILVLSAFDLSTDEDMAPGRLGQTQAQYTIGLTNLNALDNVNYDLYTIVINPGTLTMSFGTASSQIGVVSWSDIINSPDVKPIEYQVALENQDFYGGSFLSSLKHGVKKGAEFVHKNLPKVIEFGKKWGPKALKAAEFALPLLMGLGYDENECHRMIMNGEHKKILKNMGMTGGDATNAGMTGGKMASRKKLNQRLR